MLFELHLLASICAQIVRIERWRKENEPTPLGILHTKSENREESAKKKNRILANSSTLSVWRECRACHSVML